MKPSHLQTPRTLSECNFTTGYSSIKPARADHGDTVIVILSILILVGLLASISAGWL